MDKVQLKEKLSQEATKLGVSELARQLGLSRQSLYDLLSGKTSPSFSTAEKVERLSDLSLNKAYDFMGNNQGPVVPESDFNLEFNEGMAKAVSFCHDDPRLFSVWVATAAKNLENFSAFKFAKALSENEVSTAGLMLECACVVRSGKTDEVSTLLSLLELSLRKGENPLALFNLDVQSGRRKERLLAATQHPLLVKWGLMVLDDMNLHFERWDGFLHRNG